MAEAVEISLHMKLISTASAIKRFLKSKMVIGNVAEYMRICLS